MRAKPASTNISTALAAVTRPFRLLLGGRFPRSKRSHSNVLGTATLVLLTLLAFSLTPPSPSYAATLTVCASGCYTTIAAAIAAANPLGGDTISIQDASHNEANITVDRDLTIQGQGATNTAVDGTGISGSVFTISAGVTATIQDVTIRNGSAFLGGGIYNNGTVTISNGTLSGNSAGYGGGGILNGGGATATISNSTLSSNSAAVVAGGILNEGTLTISNSTLSSNSAAVVAGGILNEGTLTISNSTLSSNSAAAGAGGILNGGTLTISNSTLPSNSAAGDAGGIVNGGTLTISNSTLSGNSAGVYGGGIYNNGFGATVTISNSTLSGNSAGVYGGGIYNVGTVTISNSTLSGNSAPGGGSLANFNAASVKNSIVGNSSGGNCYGTITASGANLDTDGSCRSISFTTVTPAQLNLGPLALNPPGTTATQALLPGSAAINAATNCTDVSGNSVTTDQRGVARPDNGESACDIGAFELVDRTLLASFSAKLSLQFNQGAINLNSAFTLGAGSDGIFPLTEAVGAVALQVGTYSTTIPAGSFRLKSNGSFMFVGTINGVSMSAKITPQGGNNYTFQFVCTGANLTGTVNPASVTLTIGDDTGTISVIF